MCGDVGMASDVTTTLSKIIQEHGKMSAEQAQSYLLKLRVKTTLSSESTPRRSIKSGNRNVADFYIKDLSFICFLSLYLGIESFP